MRNPALAIGLLLLASTSMPGAAQAVCMVPDRDLSGYKVPLAEEVRSAHAIVVGQVLEQRDLIEDPADPVGVTAYDVTIRVLHGLKGKLPGRFTVRNENTSSRYPMAVGEKHILFVSRAPEGLWIDSCGNSTRLADDRRLVRQIRIELRKMK